MWFFWAAIFGSMVVIIDGQYGQFVTNCRVCEQLCLQTIYGYQCRCRGGFHINPANLSDCIPVSRECQPGYYLNPRTRVCEDLNECLVQNCEQVCTNLPGSYQCSCLPGFVPHPLDRTRCLATTTLCQRGYSLNPRTGLCEVRTTNCPPGYALNPRNASSCIDINECGTVGRCQQKCVNLIGGYRCTCRSGYLVSSADRTKCEEIRECTATVDLVLVIDSSQNVGYDNLQLLLSFAAELVRHFQISSSKARFSAILFSDSVKSLFRLDDYRTVEEVTDGILGGPYLRGAARINEAFDFIRENDTFSTPNGGRSNAPDTVVLLTGSSSTNPTLTRASAENLKNQGVRIVVVGIGPSVSEPELSSVASTRADLILAEGFEYLDYIQQQLDGSLCPGSQPART